MSTDICCVNRPLHRIGCVNSLYIEFSVNTPLYHISIVNRPLQTNLLRFLNRIKILKNLAGTATQLIRKLKSTCSARIGKSRPTQIDLVTDRMLQRPEWWSQIEWPCPDLDLPLSLTTGDFATLRRSLGLIRTDLLSPQDYTSRITISYHSRLCDMWRVLISVTSMVFFTQSITRSHSFTGSLTDQKLYVTSHTRWP